MGRPLQVRARAVALSPAAFSFSRTPGLADKALFEWEFSMSRLRVFIGLLGSLCIAGSSLDARAAEAGQAGANTTLRIRTARAARLSGDGPVTQSPPAASEPDAAAGNQRAPRLMAAPPAEPLSAEAEAFRFGSTAFSAVHSRPQRSYQRGGLGPIVPDTRRRPLGW